MALLKSIPAIGRAPHSNADRIDPSATWELNYWASQWGVSPDQLVRAMAEVGTNVRVVRQHCALSRQLKA